MHDSEKGYYFELYQFLPLSTQIDHCYVYSENNVLSYPVMILQAAHVYLEGGFYHKYPLCVRIEYFQAHITFIIDSNCSTSYCQDKIVEIFR